MRVGAAGRILVVVPRLAHVRHTFSRVLVPQIGHSGFAVAEFGGVAGCAVGEGPIIVGVVKVCNQAVQSEQQGKRVSISAGGS